MIPRGWIAGAAVLALIGAGVAIDRRGYARGGHAAEARMALAQADLERRLENATRGLRQALAALDTERTARDARARGLEHDAKNDAGADRPALPAASVRRLKARWAD